MGKRFVIKVAGAAGQGIKSAGLILAKGLKRAGYYSFGYTEYPSLIRGGHNVFQIEISDSRISSVSKQLDILLALNEQSINIHKQQMEAGGVVLFDEGAFSLKPEDEQLFQQKKVQIFPLPLLDLAKDSGGSALMKNTVSLGAVWKLLGLDLAILQDIIGQIFNKTEAIKSQNFACAAKGYAAISQTTHQLSAELKPNPEFANYLIITGNEAVGLGAIAAGVRLYSTYPMTPTSAVLSYLAEEGTKYGMVVKQAEDEITAANMVIGAYYAGTRAMCATSGGGFDLMSEAVSLAGMTETPFVALVGQRPGPATGVPTWTAQGDLQLAVYAGHGEFPRIVMALSDAEDAFYLTAEAHNLAERYQTPVIILTDKFIGESEYSIPSPDQERITINRGKLIQGAELKNYQGKLRYELTDDGISARWLPGDPANTFLANSDEHTEKGYSTENGEEIAAMFRKRMLKETTIRHNLPDPHVYGDRTTPEICVISWGSNKGVILDAMEGLKDSGHSIAYVHFTYLWPLKTEKLLEIAHKAKKVLIVEDNYRGQLHLLLKQEAQFVVKDSLNRYDGRPFTIEEVTAKLKELF